MFDREFYPTPVEVINLMQIDCTDKIVLEPSAGKGDIIDYLKENGAHEILAFEKNINLQKIVREKARFLGSDFLKCKSHDISHINQIVMNPPFSNADEHITHAYNVAPEGCEIIALFNWETFNNPYVKSRKQFKSIIDNFGNAENLGPVFSQAERTTGIDIGLVKIYKPIVSEETDFNGFFMDDDEEEEQGEGIMKFNEVRALVQRYVGAMKVFDKLKYPKQGSYEALMTDVSVFRNLDKKMEQYQKAKDNVLFNGFDYFPNNEIILSNKIEFIDLDDNLIIDDLIKYKPTLTKKGLDISGLNR